jgi:multiple sugar transport system permease protein
VIYKNQTPKAVLFMLPAFLLIALFYAMPVAVSVFYSFTDKALVGLKSQKWNFVWFDNYRTMLTDKSFGIALANTVIFLVFSAIIGQQVLGFVIAYYIEKSHGLVRKFAGLAVLLGWVTPEVVVSFIFFAFLNTDGSLNSFLAFFGLKPVAWLFDYAMIAIIFANIWRGTAFSMLMFQSALGNVDESVKEAATIDGAGKFTVLTRIVLPIISGSIMTNTILITLQTLGLFGLIYSLTGGGPGYKTTTLPIYMYNKAFSAYQLGYGTAMAIVLLLFGMLLSVFYTRSLKQEL